MRKLILEEWITLDGYVADRNGNLDFFPTTEENSRSDMQQLTFLETIDTMLLGRKTYELFVGFWPTEASQQEIISSKLNSLSKTVVSKSLHKAPWGKWPDATIIHGDVVAAVQKMKNQPGKDIVLWGSISLAQTLIKANLIDEYRLHYLPVVLGAGLQLFPERETHTKLKLVESWKYEESGVIFSLYRS